MPKIVKVDRKEYDLEKLPQWVQQHIQTIERQRDSAIEALNSYLDSQTPSPFICQEYVSTGEKEGGGPTFKSRFIQAHKMGIVHMGVRLEVRPEDKGIRLQWSEEKRDFGEVAFVPTSFQCASLIAQEHMRKR